MSGRRSARTWAQFARILRFSRLPKNRGGLIAKLLFLQNIEFEFLGPMYISSYVKQRHECRLCIGTDLDDFRAEIQTFKPDVIGFSVMTGQHRWAINIARGLKKEFSARTMLGGPHPTFFPECIEEEGVDIVCRGEGEEAVLELLDRIDSGADISAIENLCLKSGNSISRNGLRTLQKDLDAFPFPDRSLYHSITEYLDHGVVPVITSRGCVFNCTFCFEESLRKLYTGKGSFTRVRSVENVLQELKELKRDCAPHTIYFCDDIFGTNTKWLYPFLERYKREINLEFICLVRADIVCSDTVYARKLKEAGCKNVFFGIETGSEEIRNKVLNKRLKDADIHAAARLLHEAGIKFRTYNILGLPDETLADAFSTVAMNVAIKADFPWCSVFLPYPRTALARYAFEKGYLNAEIDPDTLPQSFFIESELMLPDIKRIENLQKFFQTAVLLPFTLPFIKLIIKFPPNLLFRFWFSLVYFYVHIRSENRGFFKTMVFALRNGRHILFKG